MRFLASDPPSSPSFRRCPRIPCPSQGEMSNLANTSDAARAAEAALDAALRSVVDYPAVAQDIANYELAMFRYWANHTRDWRTDIVSASLRWQQAFEANSALAMAAVEAFMSQGPGDAEIVPCDGRLTNLGA